MKFIDLTGQRFGKLAVVKRVKSSHDGKTKWECVCDCGVVKSFLGKNMRNGSTSSCGCYNSERLRLQFRKKPYESLYNTLLRASKNRHTVELTYEEFLEFTKIEKCHYCGSEVQWSEYNKSFGSRYNLDRKDNNVGYVKENLVVCCLRCNYGKGRMFTYNQWLAIGEYISLNTKLFRS